VRAPARRRDAAAEPSRAHKEALSRRRRIVGRGVALIGAVLLAGIAVEVALRVLGASPCGGGRPPLWRPRSDVGWALIPGATGDVLVCDGAEVVARQSIAINDLGQRDRPRSFARAADRPRVLVLGDSMVEATQVALHDTFVARLEAALDVEVLNGGVSGYSTDNELRFFAESGARYGADLVLLVFFVGNDVAENGARLYFADAHGLPPKPWLHAEDGSPFLDGCMALHRLAARLADALPEVLWRHSRILRAGLTSGADRLLRFVCADALGARAIERGPERLGSTGSEDRRLARGLEPERGAARAPPRRGRAAAARGSRSAIAPAGIELDPRLRLYEMAEPALARSALDFGYPARRLGRFLDDQHIARVSLDDRSRAHLAATGRSGYFVGDGHWNEEGHAVVASSPRPVRREPTEQGRAALRPSRPGSGS
jgi:hypothetical protein